MMDMPRYNAARAVSGVAVMAIIGLFGCYYGDSDLDNIFLEGIPFPLIYLNIFGIALEAVSLVAVFAMGRWMSDLRNRHPMAMRNTVYVFGGVAISIMLFLFYVGYNNFFSSGGGGDGYNRDWGSVIIVAYIGIMSQAYLLYKVQKCDSGPPGGNPGSNGQKG